MLGSRAWGPWAALCTGVPRGARAALGCCSTLRRTVLGPWDSGLIAVGSAPQQAYSVTLSRCGRWGRGGFPSPFFLGPLQNPWPCPPGQAPEPSAQCSDAPASRGETEDRGLLASLETPVSPPPSSSGSSERRPEQGCPAEILLMENPQQPGPRLPHSLLPPAGGRRGPLLPASL